MGSTAGELALTSLTPLERDVLGRVVPALAADEAVAFESASAAERVRVAEEFLAAVRAVPAQSA